MTSNFLKFKNETQIFDTKIFLKKISSYTHATVSDEQKQ